MLRQELIGLAAVLAAAVVTPAAAQNQSAVPALPAPTASGYAPVNGVEVWYQT